VRPVDDTAHLELAVGAAAPASPRGRIEVEFARAPDGETYLRRQHASYPYHLCRPHRFAGDPAGMATLYLQSCAGGIYAGDRLEERIAVREGARAQVTTQASTIVHSMVGSGAAQSVRIEAEPGAFVEYLPDPLILFPNASFETRLGIRVAANATVVACDSFLMHDPDAHGRAFDRLAAEIAAETPDGRLLALDRFEVAGATMQRGLAGVAGRFAAHGAMWVLSRDRPAGELVETLRDGLDGVAGIYAGASLLPNEAGAAVRMLAEDGVALRAGLFAAWAAARLALTGATPEPRRK
jgi:urease accessory protein